MVTLDTSGLMSYFNSNDPEYQVVSAALEEDPGPWIIPSHIMAEICWMIDKRIRRPVLGSLLRDIENGVYSLDCGDQDIARIRELVEKYDDMPLGFADAAVIACAERHGGRVLTLDHRHFGVLARDAQITILP